MKRTPTTIDDYLAAVTDDRRAALDDLRKTIRKVIPKAEECISYRIPAFRLDGRVVAGFAATKKGCSYFPFSGSTLRTLAADLKGYDGTKSSLHFDPHKPLSMSRSLKRGASLDEVSAAVGHSSPVVTRRYYDHLVRDTFSAKLRQGLGIKAAVEAGKLLPLHGPRHGQSVERDEETEKERAQNL